MTVEDAIEERKGFNVTITTERRYMKKRSMKKRSTMSNCRGCDYDIETVIKGYCTQCRSERASRKNTFIQRENKRNNADFSDLELEEMTDGMFVNTFGHARHVTYEHDIDWKE
jgi:hypothetical protein